jgi:hypothetical protein
MKAREAVVIGVYRCPDGAYKVALEAYCPPNCERLNAMVAGHQLPLALERRSRGALRAFTVALPADPQLGPGNQVVVEFFYPGEQAGAH